MLAYNYAQCMQMQMPCSYIWALVVMLMQCAINGIEPDSRPNLLELRALQHEAYVLMQVL